MRKRFISILLLLVLYSLIPAQNIYNNKIEYSSINNLIHESLSSKNVSGEDNLPHTDITIFPNQDVDELYVKTTVAQGQVKIDIYNALGKLVKLSRISNFDDDYIINVSDLCNGVYFLNIRDAKSFIRTQKLVIDRN